MAEEYERRNAESGNCSVRAQEYRAHAIEDELGGDGTARLSGAALVSQCRLSSSSSFGRLLDLAQLGVRLSPP